MFMVTFVSWYCFVFDGARFRLLGCGWVAMVLAMRVGGFGLFTGLLVFWLRTCCILTLCVFCVFVFLRSCDARVLGDLALDD